MSNENQNKITIDNLLTINDKNYNDIFNLVYKTFNNKVYYKCYSLIKDKEVAKELTQEIFIKVFENFKSFKGTSSLSTWLYSITYNHCIEYLRKNKKVYYPNCNIENELPDIIDEEDEILENKINEEKELEKLNKILDIIHPEEKALILMKYQDNLPIKEIEKILKLSESAIKMRLKRARARILYLYKKLYKEKEKN